MTGRLEGRVAIVTGGAGFLGTSHCLHLAAEGARVVVADVADGSDTVAAVRQAGGEALYAKLDVTDWDGVHRFAQELLERFGRIDVLVNNAAGGSLGVKPWTDYSLDEWKRIVDVDLTGMFVCCRAVFPVMKEQGGG